MTDPVLPLPEWTWTLGSVAAPFGRVGELKVNIACDDPERFQVLKRLCLRPLRGVPKLVTVERVRLHKGQALLKIEGVDCISEADAWRGALVQIRRSEALPLPDDAFYVTDIVGMCVVTRDGRVLGPLEDVLRYPAYDLLKIGDVLIPAVREMVVEIDRDARRIVVDPPEGLLP